MLLRGSAGSQALEATNQTACPLQRRKTLQRKKFRRGQKCPQVFQPLRRDAQNLYRDGMRKTYKLTATGHASEGSPRLDVAPPADPELPPCCAAAAACAARAPRAPTGAAAAVQMAGLGSHNNATSGGQIVVRCCRASAWDRGAYSVWCSCWRDASREACRQRPGTTSSHGVRNSADQRMQGPQPRGHDTHSDKL